MKDILNRTPVPVRPIMPRTASTSTFQSGVVGPNRTEFVAITGTCKPCMAQARDVYDGLHKAHTDHADHADHAARVPSPVPEKPKD